uniref:Uncharacterized protein n=2 Tax=Hordeum vulgare subsp. vulgare TaxID=112509 RepID=A0A8I6YYB7_HORVV
MATKRSMATLGDKDLRGKKTFRHAYLNVLSDDVQNITDDNRIRASVSSIKSSWKRVPRSSWTTIWFIIQPRDIKYETEAKGVYAYGAS